MLRIYILIVVIGLVGGVVYGGWYYYKDTQARIQVLTENSAKLEIAATTQKNTIDTLMADAKKYAELNSELRQAPRCKHICFSIEKALARGAKKTRLNPAEPSGTEIGPGPLA